MAHFQLGSISHGTLRTEDLLPAFADTLEDRGSTYESAPDMWDSIRKYRTLIDEDMLDTIDTDSQCLLAELINETLFDALQTLCPPFVYFGTLEGDGADFGFWPNYDGMTEANIDGLDEFQADGVIVEYTGNGNVTVMDMERNVLWSVV